MPLDLTGKSFFNFRNNKQADENVVEDAEFVNDKEPVSQIKSTSKNKSPWVTIKPKYSLDDLILDEATYEALLDAACLHKHQDKLMNVWGLSERFADKASLTINLYGESGTGKTMAAHALANELGKEILFVDYAEIESKYVGETAKNIKQLFEVARELDAVIVFDEADALLSKRVTDMRSSADVSVNQTRSVLLNILNDYTGVVIFTTNFIQNFDSAFIRRIRHQIKFNLPNKELRMDLWRMYIPEKMPAMIDFNSIAEGYEGISGSDISNAVFNAALKAARCGKESVTQEDFETSIVQIIQAKKDNMNDQSMTITKRVVSEEYVKEQLGDRFPKEKE